MNGSTEKSWQARISESTDAIAQKFVESISYDRRIYKQDIAGSIAHATMLAKVGLITDAERDAIVEGLKSIERDIEAGSFVFDESLEDIHMVIEDALTKRIGEPGKKLHTGRSRNDQVATDIGALDLVGGRGTQSAIGRSMQRPSWPLQSDLATLSCPRLHTCNARSRSSLAPRRLHGVRCSSGTWASRRCAL